jgi:putative hydrolase of the HAD superfamily
MHDEEIWVTFTADIVRGMGGDAAGARPCAAEIVRRWEDHTNFDLYDDAVPVIETLRGHGLRLGLISNGQRNLEEFARHHALDVDVAVGSKAHGRTKPHASIFETALAALETMPDEAVMVGDSYADDIEGARALGMRAILLDRDERYPDEADRITDLRALPALLGLTSAG